MEEKVYEYLKRLVSVPDEESYSVGMRGAAGFLADLRERVNRKSLLVELPEILHALIENM